MHRFIAAGAAATILIALIATARAADFDAAAATEAYLATLTGEARAKSDAYFEGGYWLTLYNALAGIGAAALLLFTRVSSGLRTLATRLVPFTFLQTMLYAVLVTALTLALQFPLSHYEGFVREHEFALSNQTFAEWLNEYFIDAALNLVVGGFAVAGLYAVIRRAPRTWWLWGAAAFAMFAVVMATLAPLYISPLFNEYKPMREGVLKEQILSMARANGVPASDVYEVDASRQSKRISANVQGFMGTTRISLNDNLLNRATPAEVRAVMGHEIGHYALGHVNEMLVYMTVLIALAFAFVQWGFAGLVSAFGKIWGVRDITDPAGFPAITVLVTLFFLFATPVMNTIVRTNEAEADIYGLNAAREPDGFATIALKLSEYRKLDPKPWEEFVFYDHPSGRSRIAMAMKWKAENLGPRDAAPAAPVIQEPEPAPPAAAVSTDAPAAPQ